MRLNLVILILYGFLHCINSYKILGVFPMYSKSHHIVGLSLMKGLAEKGHDVTMITPFEERSKLQNLRFIGLPETVNKTKEFFETVIAKNMNANLTFLSRFLKRYDMGINLTNLTLQEPIIQKLLNSNEKFDLIINEIFLNEALLGLGHRFKAPTIGVSAFGASTWTTDLVGSPSPPSYVSEVFLGYTDHMNFKERLINFVVTAFDRILLDNFYLPRQVALYEKYFKNPKPHLLDLRRNVSLVLLNSHFSISYPRPYMPNMIEMSGIHLNINPKPLPTDIKHFMDSANNGVIYFSMGSNAKSMYLPREKILILLKAFSTLKQKVLFKWEESHLPDQPDNVMISKWFPQDDILAHPNLKLFVTHGGLLSSIEVLYHGVPVLCLPIFGDQFLNAERTQNSGFGLKINFEDVTFKDLSYSLDELLHNSKYKDKVLKYSEIFKDRPIKAMENAIYWIEYVARYKGAPHLHSNSQQLNFIQYHNLDVLGLIFSLIVLILYLIIKLVLKFLFSGNKPHYKTKIKKH